MAEGKVLFNGSGNVEYKIFYFKNTVTVEAKGETKARALISYLRGPFFEFNFDNFTGKG